MEQARQAPVEDPQRRATRSRRWCSASIRARAAFRSASSRSRAIRGTSWPSKYPVGTTITGKVRNLTEFGAFVEVEDGIDGLIHISDMSWSKIKHPSEVLKKGDTVEAQVLSIDAENQRLSLGLKQLQTGIWKEFFDKHHVGDIVEGKVVRLTNFGAFVELADGIEGLIHVSEFDSSQGGEKLELRAGENYQMKIIRLVPEERKIGLSIRALKDEEFRADWEAYTETTGRPEVTLGDHFKHLK